MPENCAQCATVQLESEKSQSYPHLRPFYYRYSDDLLSHTFYFCVMCGTVWREDDCDYPTESGYFWNRISVAMFLRDEGEYLPTDVDQTPDGFSHWIRSFSGRYIVDLFRRYYE